MAYSEKTAERIAEILTEKEIHFSEKKMFGGIAFMINDKMCIGIAKDELMLRVLDEKHEEVLEMRHVKPMMFTGKPMKGFVNIEDQGFTDKKSLASWIDLGIEFGKFGVVKSKKKNSKKG